MTEEGENQPKIAAKRIKFGAITEIRGEDRISSLPDCLLVEILSRLGSTEDAIRTGTLSHRWKHIWTSIPVLIFKHFKYKQPWSDFVSLVDKTLTQHRQLKLKKFVLSTRYGNRSKIESWIRYAMRCNVEELNLDLWDAEHGPGFQLDQSFLINSCFKDLRLSGCILDPNGAISWKNLTSLWITDMNLDDDMMKNIFSGSPVLETLVLEYCYCYRRLDISSKSIKKLVLYGCDEHNSRYDRAADILEISAPNILSLTIKGRLSLWNLFLRNMSSLVEAGLDYRNLPYWAKKRREEMLKRFILNISHVKELKIGPSCYKVLSRLIAKGFVVPSNIKLPGENENANENESESESESESENANENESESESESECDSDSKSKSESEIESDSESGSDLE